MSEKPNSVGKIIGKVIGGILGVMFVCYLFNLVLKDAHKDSKSPPIRQSQIDSLTYKIDSLKGSIHIYDSLLNVQSLKIDSIEVKRINDVNKINKKYENLKNSIHTASDDNIDSILLSSKKRRW